MAAHRDELLAQIRNLPIEDREFIEAALLRESYEQRHRTDSEPEGAEVTQRAADALAHPERGFSREESIARAKAAVGAVRKS